MTQVWIPPLRWAWRHIKSFLPKKLNFIIFHCWYLHFAYIYVITLTFIASILVFVGGGLDYVDALFFGSGAATQSGLNTVDLNQINTYQQAVLYLIPLIATPIFINTIVVAIRIYWFELRFQHIVRESKIGKRSRTANNSRSDVQVEQGLFETRVDDHNDPREDQDPLSSSTPGDTSSSSVEEDNKEKESSSRESPPGQATAHGLKTLRKAATTQIAGKRGDDPSDAFSLNSEGPLVQKHTLGHHIAFVESQRNPRENVILRIPGPRDFDLGHKPETLDPNDDEKLKSGTYSTLHVLGRPDDSAVSNGNYGLQSDKMNAPDETQFKIKKAISFDQHLKPGKSLETNPQRGISRAATTGNILRAPSLSKSEFAYSLQTIRSKVHIKKAPTVEVVKPDGLHTMRYLSYTPTVGRNSAFVNLTQEQREELGGIEYRALRTLAIILVGYYIGFHFLAWICLLPWILRNPEYGQAVTSQGIGRPWWAFFTASSLFSDLGYTLTPTSMIPFRTAVFPILLGSFLIIIGNTGFPCMLRLVIWLCSKMVPVDGQVYEELRFLLDHPRRCFTLLFPSRATWWLFWTLAIFNGVDLIFFIILDLNDDTVLSLSPGIRVLAGWFQATSTRTAGFAVINLAELSPAIQVSYMIMMYVSVFPIAMSVRRTNVFEERSLGIWGKPAEDADAKKNPSYIGAHLRQQLSFDMWYIFLGLFIISIAEGKYIEDVTQDAFTSFSILFEIVSAYGTVGLSLGHPEVNTSLSGKFSVVSKLIIIAMQIRGRHRSLPYQVDRAILLPGDLLDQEDNDRE